MSHRWMHNRRTYIIVWLRTTGKPRKGIKVCDKIRIWNKNKTHFGVLMVVVTVGQRRLMTKSTDGVRSESSKLKTIH